MLGSTRVQNVCTLHLVCRRGTTAAGDDVLHLLAQWTGVLEAVNMLVNG